MSYIPPAARARRLRRVWGYVSERPGAPLRQIGRDLGMSYSSVRDALNTLRDVYGYIDWPRGGQGARVVLVPLRRRP